VIQSAASRSAPAGPIWLPSANPHRDHIRSLGRSDLAIEQ
jgi:hypothetical protein